MLHLNPQLKTQFPNLAADNHQITSNIDVNYNCIAWAMDENDVWWWPDHMNIAYWPDEVPREETIKAFTQAFLLKGYTQCNDSVLEQGFEKIALYALNQKPTHASRQLANGHWSSKLGQFHDISHNIDALDDPEYGNVILYFKRQV